MDAGLAGERFYRLYRAADVGGSGQGVPHTGRVALGDRRKTPLLDAEDTRRTLARPLVTRVAHAGDVLRRLLEFHEDPPPPHVPAAPRPLTPPDPPTLQTP